MCLPIGVDFSFSTKKQIECQSNVLLEAMHFVRQQNNHSTKN